MAEKWFKENKKREIQEQRSLEEIPSNTKGAQVATVSAIDFGVQAEMDQMSAKGQEPDIE